LSQSIPRQGGAIPAATILCELDGPNRGIIRDPRPQTFRG